MIHSTPASGSYRQVKVYPALLLLAGAAALALGACGGSTGSTGSQLTTTNFAGVWTVSEPFQNTCGSFGGGQETMIVSQNGNAATVEFDGDIFIGRVTNGVLTWSGTLMLGQAFDYTSVAVQLNGVQLTGTIAMRQATGPDAGCTFTRQIAGVRDASGSWLVEDVAVVNAGDCPPTSRSYSVNVSQQGSIVTLDTPFNQFSATSSGNTITWSGSYPDGLGVTTIANASVTINGTAFSGGYRWSWTNGLETCSGIGQLSGSLAAQAVVLATSLVSGNWHITTADFGVFGDTDPIRRQITLESGETGLTAIDTSSGQAVPAYWNDVDRRIYFEAAQAIPGGAVLHESFDLHAAEPGEIESMLGVYEWWVERDGQVAEAGMQPLMALRL